MGRSYSFINLYTHLFIHLFVVVVVVLFVLFVCLSAYFSLFLVFSVLQLHLLVRLFSFIRHQNNIRHIAKFRPSEALRTTSTREWLVASRMSHLHTPIVSVCISVVLFCSSCAHISQAVC